MDSHTETNPVSMGMLAGSGIWLIALGLCFALPRPTLLPQDPRFMGTAPAQIGAHVAGLENWLKRVFTVMDGFMAVAGVLTVFLATTAMRLRLYRTTSALALAGAMTVGLMIATNFGLHSDFRWLLLVPAVVCFAGLAVHVAMP